MKVKKDTDTDGTESLEVVQVQTKTIKKKGAKPKRRARGKNRSPKAACASRKHPKKRSIVWQFFNPLETVKGEYKGSCQLCDFVSNNPTGTTAYMRQHLIEKHAVMYEKALEEFRINQKNNERSNIKPRVKTPAVTSYRNKRGSVRPVSLPPSPEIIAKSDIEERNILEQERNDTTTIESMKLSEDGGNDDSDLEITNVGECHIFPAPPLPLDVYSHAEVDTIMKSVLDHLVTNIKPLRSVEDPTFINLLYSLNKTRVNELFEKENWSILKAVTQHLEETYEEMQETIRQEVSGKSLSLSIDFWVKSKSEIFAVVAANYISDDWTLPSKLLGMRKLPKVFTGRPGKILVHEVTLPLTELLNEYQITPDSVIIVVVNASPFEIDFNILNRPTWHCVNETFRDCCLKLNQDFKTLKDEDILNSCLKFSLDAIPDFDDIRHHPGRLLAAVKEHISNLTSREDNQDHLLEHIEAYNLIQEPLTRIIDGLLEASTVPASLLLPVIVGLLIQYESVPKVPNPTLSKGDLTGLIETVKASIQKGYQVDFTLSDLGDVTIALCTFLDPRYKAPLYFSEELRQKVFDTTMELLMELKEKEKKEKVLHQFHSENQSNATNAESGPLGILASASLHGQSQNPVPSTSNTFKLNLFINEAIQTRKGGVPTASFEIQEELNKYMAESKVCMSESPLEWWRHNCGRFPNLSVLARRYNCIQGSTSPAYRTFTPEGQMFFKNLALIEPEYMEKLMCVRCNSVASVNTVFGYMESRILQNIPVPVMSQTEDIQIPDEDDECKLENLTK